MIVYFADRDMKVLGQATTNLPHGFVIVDDLKTEEVDTGTSSFSCWIGFNEKNRPQLEKMTEAGNYILRSNDGENEFYTIIDTEIDTKRQEIYIYAEDAGLDLINEIAGEFEAPEAHNVEWYFNKFAGGSGFEIGINEIPADKKLKLKWEGESTVTERLASIATQFGGYELSYTFAIKGLEITNKYINIHKERGKDNGVQLRLNKEIDKIVTAKSVANLVTAFKCEGGVPDKAEEPITLKGYVHDDGDFFVDANGVLKSRKANEKWRRFVWNKKPQNQTADEGYIMRPYSYNTTDQKTLCSHAIAELKKFCDTEINYEIDVKRLPEGTRIGDRVNIIDDAGELYISSRILQLETSVVGRSHKATIGEHLIKKSGISQKVADLAEQFAKTSLSAARALQVAESANTAAAEAQRQAEAAAETVEEAQKAVEEAEAAVVVAQSSAATAEAKAIAAEAAVGRVESSVASIQTSVENAELAAENAQNAAVTAEAKAAVAETAASNAASEAAKSEAAAGEARTAAEGAVSKADSAISTAGEAKTTAQSASDIAAAAKLDSEQAKKDVEDFGRNLETTVSTMKADYARKTDLTETSAQLESQIRRNAGLLSSTITARTTIDETANDAQTLAQQAKAKADKAIELAKEAEGYATEAQSAADDAQESAEQAQAEADVANAAAATAQAVLDQAEADLATARADLETITGRADATEEEIAAAEQAVAEAQAAVNVAKTTADTATETAAAAQATANTAAKTAEEAQATADAAALSAENAQSLANEYNAAYGAQSTADSAVGTAANAQTIANTAAANATAAQAKADKAVEDAAVADQAAKDAAVRVTEAQTTLANAKQTLADTLARGDATEAEIAEAEQAVINARAAVNAAIQSAAQATSAAKLAAAFAKDAQTAADEAQSAADQAQAVAAEAKRAADQAKDDADSLKVRVEATETAINQTRESIKLLATQEELATMQIGGRNLLAYSTITRIGSTGGGADVEWHEADVGTGVIKHSGWQCLAFDVSLAPNTTYTLSAKAITNAHPDFSNCLSPFIWNSETGNPVQDFGKLDGGTPKTFTTNGNVNSNHLFAINLGGTRSERIIDCIKLEKGNKATDWTPAPEDTLEQFADMNDKLDAFQVGGTNIAIGTGTAKGWYNFTSFDANRREFTCVNSVFQSPTTKRYFKDNQDYTLSFYAKQSNVAEIVVRTAHWLENSNNLTEGSFSYIIGTATTEYKKYSLTVNSEARLTGSDRFQLLFGIRSKIDDAADATIYIKDIMLEEGNKASAWAPAQEDIIDEILQASEDLRGEFSQQYSDIITEAERITLQHLGDYVKSDEYGVFKEETETALDIEEGALGIKIKTAETKISEVDETVQAEKTLREKHFAFTDNGLIIRSNDTNDKGIRLQLDNDEGINFYKSGLEQPFGRWDGENFYTGNIVIQVTKRAQFGNFAFVPRSDGSLMFLKVGGKNGN